MSVTPRGMSVQEAYREYRQGNFRVNRRYQRKLVWTIGEKQALVDSVLHGFPIPLILLAYTSHSDGSKSFEILDGMQRLNALFSFIENRFAVDGSFFDVSQLARAQQLADEGAFEVETEKERLLSPIQCANYLDYTLAVTEFPATDDSAVNEVFGRINAYGRQLSAQERRQAGVVTPFANLVRELGAELRGDVSADSLDLADMPAISIDVGKSAGEYGVSAEDTFWCKQGVLRRNQLRDSEDEQMIADLAISILRSEPFSFSGNNLDLYYDGASEESKEANSSLVAYGSTRLKHEIQATLSILRDTVEAVDASDNALRRIVHPKAGANPIKTAFYAVFFAFFELCVQAKKSPSDPKKIMEALESLQDKLHISAGQIRGQKRRQNVDLTKGLIQSYFVDKEPPAVNHGSGSALRFENAIRRSRVETAAFECKQGLLTLDTQRALSPSLLDRLVETIAAIANLRHEEAGLFIGVADNEADRRRVEELDSVEARLIGNRYCVGVDRELQHLGRDLDGYKRLLVDHFAASDLSSPLKEHVLGEIDCIVYRGLSVISIWIPQQASAAHVKDEVFFREGSSTKKASGLAQTKAVLDRFA